MTAPFVALALIGGACADPPADARPAAITPATTLRAALTGFFGEHVNLVATATGHLLAGRPPAFMGAGNALEKNGQDLALAISEVYGTEASDSFLPIWRVHIGFLIDYARALAEGSATRAGKAKSDLRVYAREFAAFIDTITVGEVDEGEASELVMDHVRGLERIADAQKAKKLPRSYAELRGAVRHAGDMATVLSRAFVRQFPDKFRDSRPVTKAGDLRVELARLFGEHANLVTEATGHRLAGDPASFDAAAAKLDENSRDLASVLGAAYDEKVRNDFLARWRKHIDLFMQYAQGLRAGDGTQANQVLVGLLNDAQGFGSFIERITDGRITKTDAAGLLRQHIAEQKGVMDGQRARNWPAMYNSYRAGYAHMREISDTFAEAIVRQFPGKF